MCIQNALQQHILEITNGGKDIADFFYATMHGQNSNAKIHHQIDAAKQLRTLGLDTALSLPTGEDPASANADVSQSPLSLRVRANAPSPSTGEGWDGGENSVRPEPVEGHAQEHTPSPSTAENPAPSESKGRDRGENYLSAGSTSQDGNPAHSALPVKSAPVTDFDIINYEVARLIREETNDGYLIADFLTRAMRGADTRQIGCLDKKDIISPADRMAAAKELLNRGLGRFGDCRSRRLPNNQDDHDLINSGLARYIRERTDHGLEAARLLLDVASGTDEDFSMHQRVSATRELLRRGWDTNYDAVTPEDIAAYYERQDAREPTGYDIRLRQWREEESAAQASPREDNPREEEPQLEPGIFAHLTEAEITRYEAMSAEEQTDFAERQRQRHATRQSAPSVISALAEIHTLDTPDDSDALDQPGENSENINWNTLLRDVSAPSRTPHPVRSESLTRIRSP